MPDGLNMVVTSTFYLLFFLMDLEIILRNIIHGDYNSKWNFQVYVKHRKEDNTTI